MNLENFAEYLKYPSRLYQLPYEELKSLTMQYPYCANFHVLLLIKSKLESHPDLEKNLARAATYSVDRKYLRKIFQEDTLLPVDTQFNVGEDEVLELQDLLSLEDRLETVRIDQTAVSEDSYPPFVFDPQQIREAASTSTEESSGQEWSLDPDQAGPYPETEAPVVFPAESFVEEVEPKEVSSHPPVVPEEVKDHSALGIPDAAGTPTAYRVPESLIRNVSAVIHIGHRFRAGWAAAIKLSSDSSAPAFALRESLVPDCAAVSTLLRRYWDRQQHPAVLEWDLSEPVLQDSPRQEIPLPTNIAPTPKSSFRSFRKRYSNTGNKVETARPVPIPPPNAREVAELSLREDLGVASETLAGLLVEQQQYERAIKMYEHLSLLIPEKNTYFAAKIDAIKKL